MKTEGIDIRIRISLLSWLIIPALMRLLSH